MDGLCGQCVRIVSILQSRSTYSVNGSRKVLAVAIAICGLTLGGCASAFRDKPLIGEPAEALRNAPPSRPPYPSVGVTPESTTKPMTAQERAKLEADLVDRRAKAADERRKQIQQPTQ
jgi:hypothetical protein